MKEGNRKSEFIWRAVRFAIGLPVFICEIGLAIFAANWFFKSSGIRDHLIIGFLFCFFGVQAWYIWRILLFNPERSYSSKGTMSRLPQMDPTSIEFYSAVRDYFTKRARTIWLCGLFFLSIGIVWLLTLVFTRQADPLVILFVGAGWVFCGFLGLPSLYFASGIIRTLPKNADGQSINERIVRLRIVALHNRLDPIA